MRPNITKLIDNEKYLQIDNKVYHLRGLINFFSVGIGNLCFVIGHKTSNTNRANGKHKTIHGF